MKRMKTFLLSGVVAVGLFAIIGASPALAAKKPGGGTTTSSCPGPKSTATLPTYEDAGAFATPISGGFDYFFTSTASDPLPSGGVPGLIKYCVYPSDAKTAPDVADATYNNWVASTSSKSPYPFSFGRDGGNVTNVPLDGQGNPVKIGTATWNPSTDAPTLAGQTIVLHIADPSFCLDSPTCFVKPGAPICDAGTGNTGAAYNSIPFDFPRCTPPPSMPFEAGSISEFGDQVTLGKGGELKTMTVDFQSFACGTSGNWSTNNCLTNTPGTFTVPGGITASIYKVSSGVIQYPAFATATANPSIPYRPSKDDLNCTGGKFVDPYTGVCVNSLAYPITFTFPAGFSVAAGDTVVWTVQFNTTHYGYTPIGEGETCFTTKTPECGYDSLNVGTLTYPGAPYAGTDVATSVWFGTQPPGPDKLFSDSLSCPGCTPPLGPADLLPLGEIVTG